MQYSDIYFDHAFKAIFDLRWLPFVGEQYRTTPDDRKLWIIGESHYQQNDYQSILNHSKDFWTRRVIWDLAIGKDETVERKNKTRIFINTQKALIGELVVEAEAFWNQVAYSNLVQRPMDTQHGRPGKVDFERGWEAFWKTLPILKPSACLFIGVGATNYLVKAAECSTYSLSWRENGPKINGTAPRYVTATSADDHQTPLIFIKHASERFSWAEWHAFLRSSIPEQIAFSGNKCIAPKALGSSTLKFFNNNY